ncbi:MAG: bifunctional heptose 7-phosphate kinase/heptose 1-phosphate adenyltransferase [Puniceicoccaceae bacterium]
MTDPSGPSMPSSDFLTGLFQSLARLRILVVGDLMLDHYIWGDARRISPEAPVPVVSVERDSYSAGGAANVALNLGALGVQPILAGSIGEDAAGATLHSILQSAGVEVLTLPKAAPTLTIEKTRVIVQSQQLCRIDREGDPEMYRLDHHESIQSLLASLSQVDGVILSDYGKGSISTPLALCLRDAARRHSIPIAHDPKPSRLLPVPGLDLITPNRSESLELAGLSPLSRNQFDPQFICHQIFSQHAPRNLVVTLGPDGMLLSREGVIKASFPTFAREVYDVSGAGDTVVASLLACLAAGVCLEEAIPFANLAAGVVVGKIGTATASPEEILELAREHQTSEPG